MDRLRLAQLDGTGSPYGLMLRSPSSLSDPRRYGIPARRFTIVSPYVNTVGNSSFSFRPERWRAVGGKGCECPCHGGFHGDGRSRANCGNSRADLLHPMARWISTRRIRCSHPGFRRPVASSHLPIQRLSVFDRSAVSLRRNIGDACFPGAVVNHDYRRTGGGRGSDRE